MPPWWYSLPKVVGTGPNKYQNAAERGRPHEGAVRSKRCTHARRQQRAHSRLSWGPAQRRPSECFCWGLQRGGTTVAALKSQTSDAVAASRCGHQEPSTSVSGARFSPRVVLGARASGALEERLRGPRARFSPRVVLRWSHGAREDGPPEAEAARESPAVLFVYPRRPLRGPFLAVADIARLRGVASRAAAATGNAGSGRNLPQAGRSCLRRDAGATRRAEVGL